MPGGMGANRTAAAAASTAAPIVPESIGATSRVAERTLQVAATLVNDLIAAGIAAHEATSSTEPPTLPPTPPPTSLATLPPSTISPTFEPPPVPAQQASVFIYGFCLVLVMTATILGNLLVIISVLRFKALHSAINFLILGLAMADLFVALFVMPYAVYVYVQGGYWFLGTLMCDIYSASDVACSTASILLLAVISFDRYRAVSRPIQYSRQSQNIRRVVIILIAIWLISLALASPIVLGVNYRPPDASPYECRFYNPEFSIGSSIVSFVIPCFIVLFVYIRIMVALRKREKAAKMRRVANTKETNKVGDMNAEDNDAGQIVTAPDEHDVASSSPLSSSGSLSENLHIVTNDFASEAPTSLSRKSSELDSTHLNELDDDSPHGTLKSRPPPARDKFGKSPSVIRNSVRRFKSFHVSPRSLALPNVDVSKATDLLRHLSRRSPRLFRPSPTSVASYGSAPVRKKLSCTEEEEAIAMVAERVVRRQSDSFATAMGAKRRGHSFTAPSTLPVVRPKEEPRQSAPCIVNPTVVSRRHPGALTSSTLGELGEELDYVDVDSMHDSQNSRVLRGNAGGGAKSRSPVPYSQEITASATDVNFLPLQPMGLPPIADQQTAETTDTFDEKKPLPSAAPLPSALVIRNATADSTESVPRKSSRSQGKHSRDEAASPSVTFKIPGSDVRPFRRLSSANNVLETSKLLERPGLSSSQSTMPLAESMSPKTSLPNRSFSHKSSHTNGGMKPSTEHSSDYSSTPSQATTTAGIGGRATPTPGKNLESKLKMVKRAINRKESSLKRKVNKAQRKEKRATKTLGIVVGIFLVCWVPFFGINILNAVCVLLDEPACQVGFGPFFYATWTGYLNSFMNPVIYTIFNTEFRRAFKSLILGRSNARGRHRGHRV